MIIGIDPGPTQSAIVALDGHTVRVHAKAPNDRVMQHLVDLSNGGSRLVIEYTKPYAMKLPGGRPYVPTQLIYTAMWIGRFVEYWEVETEEEPALYDRAKVKAKITGKASTKDKDVRAALIAMYGSGWKGTRKCPGPLYGVKADEWAALAVCHAYRIDPLDCELLSDCG